jgi:hypothetical protein
VQELRAAGCSSGGPEAENAAADRSGRRAMRLTKQYADQKSPQIVQTSGDK